MSLQQGVSSNEILPKTIPGINVDETYRIIGNTVKLFKEIDVSNIIDVVSHLMKLVGVYKNVSGIDKKELVTGLLKRLINETNSGKFDKITDDILLTIVPVVIDKLIDVENGKLVFNPKVKTGCGVFFSKLC